MHTNIKQRNEKETQAGVKEKEISLEANRIVNLLLNEIIEISDDADSIVEITVEEVVGVNDNSKVKNYMNKCEFCGFEVIALKRYIAIQELNKHKETCCKIIKCA